MPVRPTSIVPSQSRRKVVIVVHDKAKLLDVAGPLQVFNDAKYEDGAHVYQVILASEEGGQIATDAGILLTSERLDKVLESEVDTLLITGGDPAFIPTATASLRARLTTYLPRPRRLGSVCVGAFILAELGVLNNREATTHWGASNKLQREYPSVKVKPDSIFVQSGQIWTSAGVSAGIDMALAMVAEDIGHAAALALARKLVLFLKRGGGQSQFSVELRTQMKDQRGRFDDLHTWIRQNLGQDLSVPVLASFANMSERNFARVYRRETGESPAQSIEQMRVEAARRLLESTSDAVQSIAQQTGFFDDERMRRAFLRIHGVSPQDYRNRFGAISLA